MGGDLSGHRADDLPRPARAHRAAPPRVRGRSRPAGSTVARGPHPRVLRRPARPAGRRRRLRLRPGLRRPAAVDGDLVAARRARRGPGDVPPHHRPAVPHRARRRDDQRRLVERRDRARRATWPAISTQRQRRPRATTCSPRCWPRAAVCRRPRQAHSLRHPAAVSAGTETVARLLGWAAVVLADAPRPAGRAGGRPVAAPQRGRGAAALRGAVTGAGPVDDARRRAARHVVPAGSKVLLLTGSAGRDERAYPDADRFDIHRAHPQPRVVRLRHPLLPRRRAGPHGGAHRARGDAGAASRRGTSTTTAPSACTPAPSAATREVPIVLG